MRDLGVYAMGSVLSPVEIVNREAARHEQEASRPDRTEKQRAKHAQLVQEMRHVASEMQALAARVQELESENQALKQSGFGTGGADDQDQDPDEDGSPARGFGLSPDDLEGLPPEVMAELNITAADKFESFIVSKIRQAGGVLSLDKLIIACYRERGEVHKRNLLNAKLYRMTRKRLLWSVPKKKALYTVDPDIGSGAKALEA